MNRTSMESACEKARRYLDAYVDNELLVETSAEVLRHLESCAACAAEVEARGALKSKVRGAVRAHEAPPELTVKVRERLRARPPRPWWSPAALTMRQWAVSAAAAAVICAGVWVALPTGEPFPAINDRPAQNVYIRRISAKLAEVLCPGLADHVHCAVFRKYPANPPAAASMLAELGAYHDLLPAVNAAIPKTWRVLMAHQCSYMGRKYVHLTMRDGTSLVSLVIARKNSGESFAGMEPALTVRGVPVYESSAGPWRVAGFESGEYLAFVVSDLGKAQNLEAAALLSNDVLRVLAAKL